MFRYVIICLCVSLSRVLCDLDKEEGAECEWEGLKGQCVKETRCMTTLDKKSPKHPICSKKGDESIICCTDCELVNDTRNAVISLTSGVVYWKTGQKARDQCLQYIKELPYQCKKYDFKGISRVLNKEKRCYNYKSEEGDFDYNSEPVEQYPHQVLIGIGNKGEYGLWFCGGVIISDRFVLTSAHPSFKTSTSVPKMVLFGTHNMSDPSFELQSIDVKKFYPHPKYQRSSLYHDIALIKLEEPIQFSNNVLPACLPVDDNVSTKNAVSKSVTALQAQARETEFIDLDVFEEICKEQCEARIGKPSRNKYLKQGFDHTTQMCYYTYINITSPFHSCQQLPGQTLMINTQFPSCVYTAVGVVSFTPKTCDPEQRTIPNVFLTRVSYYLPWIESIVWP